MVSFMAQSSINSRIKDTILLPHGNDGHGDPIDSLRGVAVRREERELIFGRNPLQRALTAEQQDNHPQSNGVNDHCDDVNGAE